MKCSEIFFRKFQIIITKPQLSPKNEIAKKGIFCKVLLWLNTQRKLKMKWQESIIKVT